MDAALRLTTERTGRLMAADEAVDYLGLHTRPNPKGALKWLMRMKRLGYVRLAKGVYGLRQADLDAFIESRRVPPAGQEKTRKSHPGT